MFEVKYAQILGPSGAPLCVARANDLPDAHGLAHVQLPLPLEGVQVPELSRVDRGGDSVAAGAVHRHGGHGAVMAPHPAHQLPRV